MKVMVGNRARSRVVSARHMFSRSSVAGDFWGLSDQALISATSLVTMVIIARSLTPAEFGQFTLAYTALLLANSFQSSFVTSPHNVLSSGYSGNDYVVFTSSLAVSQIAASGVIGLLCVISAIGMGLAGISHATLIAGLGGALFFWQIQEFFRRVLYSEGRVRDALFNDVVSYAGQGATIAVLWWNGWLTGSLAMLAIAATSAAGALFGAVQVRASLSERIDRHVLTKQWEFGKWLAAGEMGFWLSSTLYTYIAAAMLGVAASGGLKAAQVILGPLNVLLFYLDVVLPIKFSKTLAIGDDADLSGAMRTAYTRTLPPVLGYSVLAAIFAAALLRLAYGADYTQYAVVVVILAATSVLSYLGRVMNSALQAYRRTKPIFHSHLVSAVLTIAIGWLLVDRFGVAGAALGIGLSSLVRYLMLLRAFRDVRSSFTAPVTQT